MDLVCLRRVYVLAVRIVPVLRLWRCGDDHKTVEILLLRHQLTVLQRQLATAGKLCGLTGRAVRSSRCCSVWYPKRAALDSVGSSPRGRPAPSGQR